MGKPLPIPESWRTLPFVADVRASGGRVWAVGGAVRDLAIEPAVRGGDLDVVVGGLDSARVAELLARTGRVSYVGKAFGVFKWTPPGGATLDVALPRTERTTGPGHRDFEIHTDPGVPIEADLERRDFTINAVAVELPSGDVIDPFDGRCDLERKRLRAVGCARERFEEDPLRMLRAGGFAARFELEVDSEVVDAMRALADSVANVSSERIANEWVKWMARSARPSIAHRLLERTRVLDVFFPEFRVAVGYDQGHPSHPLTLDEHTHAVLDGVARRDGDVVTRFAALFHDLGKPLARTDERDAEGRRRARYIGHEAISATVAEDVANRVRLGAAADFPRGGIDRLLAIVRHHRFDIGPDASDRAYRRFVRRAGGRDVAREIVRLWDADREAHADGNDPDAYRAALERIDRLVDVPLTQHALALDGATIARETGAEGREIGRIKEALLDRVVEGEIPNTREALLDAAKTLATSERPRDQ